MKKHFFVIILLISSLLTAQNVKFTIINNLADLRQSGFISTDSLHNFLHNNEEGNITLLLGNLTVKGSLTELNDAKNFTDSLGIKYKVLCGKNDYTQNISAFLNIRKIFENGSFIYESGDFAFLGIQAIDLTDNKKAHISIETAVYLKSILSNLQNKKIILFINTLPSEIDNLDIIISMLGNNNVKSIFAPGFWDDFKPETRQNNKKKKDKEVPFIPELFRFEIRNDSIFCSAYSVSDGKELLCSRPLDTIFLKDYINGKKSTCSFSSNPLSNSSTYSKLLFGDSSFLLASIDGKIAMYNNDLTVKWQHQINSEIYSSPIMAEGNIVAASINGDIVLLNQATGTEVQSIGISCEIVSSLKLIDYFGKKELLIPKSTNSTKAIVFGGVTGELFCYDLETLQDLWSNNDSSYPVAQNIIETGNKLIYKTYEGKIFCIDSRTGLLIWKWGFNELSADVYTPLYFNGKQIITLTDKNSFVGIDLLLGVLEWQSDINLCKDIHIAPDNPGVVLALQKNMIGLYDSFKGKLLKEAKFKEKNIALFIRTDDADRQTYLVSENNILYKFDKLKLLKEIGCTGGASIVSFHKSSEGILYLLNSDGQLIRITSD